ncbi:hypothetical protein BGW42_006165 [Actinomortierella wolfii]|nr:hypothetical protein BGW42_006165 [Actinomortierella wolfii]
MANDRKSSPASATEWINATLAASLDTKEKELLEHKVHLNQAIDAKLYDRIDRDPCAVWLVYILHFFSELLFSFLTVSYNVLYWFIEDSKGPTNKYGKISQVMSMCVPLLAAALSDSYLGKWWSLFLSTVIVLAVTIAMTVITIPTILSGIAKGLLLFFLGLFAFTILYLRTFVSVFGGDQFLAVQERGLARYIVLLYFLSEAVFTVVSHMYTIIENEECVWGGDTVCFLYGHILGICSALVCVAVLLLARRRFRIVPPLRSFVPFTMIKATFVATKRYFAAPPSERAMKGQWLNFAAKDHGSVFVQDIYDFGLALVLIVLPATFFWGPGDYADALYRFETVRYVRENDGVKAKRFNLVDQVSVYSTLGFAFLLAFVIFPLFERRGWSVSPYRRFGAGYVCVLVTNALSMIVNKVSKDVYASSTHLENPEKIASLKGSVICKDCVHYAAVIPQALCLTLGYVLAVPASMQIVYTESGRHLRALAMAVFLVLQTAIRYALDSSMTVDRRVADKDDILEKARLIYGITGAIGFILYLVVMRFYTPRKSRSSINDAASLAKDAEFAKMQL